MGSWRRRVIAVQAAYYVGTGVWPLVHLRSFEAVTGPKTDDWLVHTVGVLATAIGLSLGVATISRQHHGAPVIALAIGSALAFSAIDLWYGLAGLIPPVYLADAAVQLGLVALLVITRAGGSSPASLHQ